MSLLKAPGDFLTSVWNISISVQPLDGCFLTFIFETVTRIRPYVLIFVQI